MQIRVFMERGLSARAPLTFYVVILSRSKHVLRRDRFNMAR